MLGALATGYEHLSEEELRESLRCSARGADGIARDPELLGTFPGFTEQDAEEWGAMEDPAAEEGFQALVEARARKAASA